ncbi:hypothetical protein OH805_22935 [Streptomyces sp. NBC_00879]|uniref:hypothetical protein n=1 Tax=Streptomyces sp. NBC_00879 TaxID=2975855 RepID=UPI0038660624|nr:hypothetical protein OH805_22935 [Streptomyces sp. NBC_00879]
MAEDSGAGALGAFSMMPVVGGVFAAAAAAKDLVYELGEMDNFRKRVNELLATLNESEAAPDKVGADRLERGKLGGGDFREAAFLYESYNLVHTELENLSKVLGMQIEGMRLAVQVSQTGYDKVDEDIRARMRALNAKIEAYYDKDRDPYANQGTESKSEAAPQSQPSDSGTAGQDGY